jgi:hypothetical protein
MPWVISLGLLLLVMQSYQWLHGLHFPLPVSLLAAMGLALLSNSGLTWPKLPRQVADIIPPNEVLLATLEPPRQLPAAETAKFVLTMANDSPTNSSQVHDSQANDLPANDSPTNNLRVNDVRIRMNSSQVSSFPMSGLPANDVKIGTPSDAPTEIAQAGIKAANINATIRESSVNLPEQTAANRMIADTAWNPMHMKSGRKEITLPELS